MPYDPYGQDHSNTMIPLLQDAVRELGDGDGTRTVTLDLGESVTVQGHWLEVDIHNGTITVFSYDDGSVRTDRTTVDACRNVRVETNGALPTNVAPAEKLKIADLILVIEACERFGSGWTSELLDGDRFPERNILEIMDLDHREEFVAKLAPTAKEILAKEARGLLDDIATTEAFHRILEAHAPTLNDPSLPVEADRNPSKALLILKDIAPRDRMLSIDPIDTGTVKDLPEDQRTIVRNEIFAIMLNDAIRSCYQPYLEMEQYRSRLLDHLRVR